MDAKRTIRAAAAAVAALAGLGLCAGSASAAARFGPAPHAPVAEEHLFDLGVVDYDEDGFLDLFTTNHKFSSVLLHNRAGAGFSDRLAETGLSPTPEFPGLEHLGAPQMDRPGVYLYIRSPAGRQAPSYVHLRAVGMPARGTLTFGSHNVHVERHARAQVTRRETEAGHPVVTFDAAEGGILDIRLRHIDLPMAAEFEGVEARDIRVGGEAERAGERSFVLTLRDRHGYAFADLGGDPALDLFAISGGLGSAIRLPGYRGQVQDELLIGHGPRFADESNGSGLRKGTCRGRQAAAADIDADGLLDLFESCEGEPPRIYRQLSPGHFEPAPAPDSVASTYRLADLRGDIRPELIAAEPDALRVYRIGTNRAKVIQRLGGIGEGRVAQLATADLKNDGDLDVLAVSRSGNAMLANRHGRLERVPLGSLGLPRSSVAASFVDFDNDGRMDVDLVPQGLLRRVGPRFQSTGELRTPRVGAGITNWFDFDNDGLRDPVIATGRSPFSGDKDVHLSRNLTPGGQHWLEVDLVGTRGNAQAIGARVNVRCAGHHSAGFVGQNEDSRFSQGHYRLYFGLGNCESTAHASVAWPDGSEDRFGPLRTDRVVRLVHRGG